jgi:LytR cell envelope-related transcriptional attenuator
LAVVATVLTAAVIAGVVWLALHRETGGSAGSATSPSTTVVAGGGDAYVLRVIGTGDIATADVLIGAGGRPTMVLGFPAVTLVEGTAGFELLDELLRKSDPAAGFGGLERLVTTRPGGVAEVTWAALRTALVSAGVAGDWPQSLGTAQPKAAETATRALAALAAASTSGAGGKALDDLPMVGAVAGVQRSLRSLAAGPEVVGALPGKTVEGSGFVYYEPDTAVLGRLLGREPPEKAISVEVQNGSGTVGIAQKVMEVIAPMGYTMLPAKNAAGFPDVAATRIFAAPNALADADRLRRVLKRGTVVKQETLPAGRVVVVVGKDLPAESLPKPGA